MSPETKAELDKIISSFSLETEEELQKDTEYDFARWNQGDLVNSLSGSCYVSRESLNIILGDYNDALGDVIYEIILRAKRYDKAREIYYYVPDEVA